jgi:hypothetical protein
LRIPGDFHSVPSGSLRTIIGAMRSPRIETWAQADESEFSNEDWTDECQGLATIDQSWYVVSNNENRRAVYRFAFGSWDELGSAELPGGLGDHVGAPATNAGTIFVPVDGNQGPHVWMLDAQLNTTGIADLSDKPGVKDDGDIMGWCAVNPWNGFYYSSGGMHVRKVHAYDPMEAFAYRGSLVLRDAEVNGVQGGRFTANGHLYINSDVRVAGNAEPPLRATKDIRAYSSLNGAFLGSCPVEYDPSFTVAEEMEGFTLFTRKNQQGELSYVHVLILDNDLLSDDDIRIIHFTTPYPAAI